jgi:hypothetical protein
VTVVDHPTSTEGDPPLMVPLRREISWDYVHRLSQGHPRDAAEAELITTVRASAIIKRGTRMVKPVPARALALVLRSAMAYGFCYRESDTAHLRTPEDWTLLGGDPTAPMAYVLRWRAVDGLDYAQPGGGLSAIPAHERTGPPVLPSGFAPSTSELIPEFVTADMADLPLPANALLIGYTADGQEGILYSFQPEQRGWLRLAGPQWMPMLSHVPGIEAHQEYLPLHHDRPFTRLVGNYLGEEQTAVADPPDTFRVLAMTRAARYTVETLARRARYATWRGVRCTAIGAEGEWARLRVCAPDAASIAITGSQCVERGIYEVWAPVPEIADVQDIDITYRI